ncbi:MAG: septation regulator SpoVG [Exiguobacterium sp.]|uniref:Putative septation protein SpoVG n=1 Tax=Exiguobacterium alkaliphilum TaxID=1428684 RepID=A0ABT2KY57_9BACL|nr:MULTISPECIES: septation regulator SpoVG [Exiguobacterium]MDX5322454.1 septation regulator SpoVG [Exiguobacterium sp.]KDN59658.1 septation protein spoVG [Exiguobacterium sp. AB2]MCT4795867.1 septation regulator SpoVG [Exiguobacterium alkaliphilum]MDX5424179.1 septation regulator SpoVG [Exiguobacterium sp.]MDX6771698.1 septation regulator SpoVG [Exiguobacterium sp.]
MQITDVKIRKVATEGRMKALASITLDHEFVVHDLRIIEGSTGLFVAMPSKRTPEGIFRDIAHPINGDMRQKVEAAVLEAYAEIDVTSYEAEEMMNGMQES